MLSAFYLTAAANKVNEFGAAGYYDACLAGTVGLSYYGLSQEERTRFRERLKFHAGLLRQEE